MNPQEADDRFAPDQPPPPDHDPGETPRRRNAYDRGLERIRHILAEHGKPDHGPDWRRLHPGDHQ